MPESKREKETVSIHGKQYETVASRIKRFKEDYPENIVSIETELLAFDDPVVVKATLRDVASQNILATGHAEEYRGASNINKTSAMECCETSAIGRALASFGYLGTEFASADEVATAMLQQSKLGGDDESLPWILNKPCPACGFKELNIWNKDWGAGTYAYCKKKDGGCGAKFKTEKEIDVNVYRRDRLVDAISDIETKAKQQKKHPEFKAVIEKSFPGTNDWLTAGLPTEGLQVLVDLLAPASLKKTLEESISKENGS